MADSRAAAVELARRGFRVFRLNRKTLRPLREGWPESASNDPDVVYKDFTDAVGDSVIDAPAVATGKGLVVYDFDKKKGRLGLLSLAELIAEGLPDSTLTVQTATGGLHKYYWHDESVEIRNRQGLMDGVDVRGFNGFVVAPGAEREGVGEYTIVDDSPTARLPALFTESLGRRPKDRSQQAEVTDKFEDDWSIAEAIKLLAGLEAIDGQKHNDLVSTWMKCFDLGVTPDMLAELTEQHVEWFAAEYTQDLEAELGSLVNGRIRDGKAWGVDHPRARPSVYSVFDRVSLIDASHERPRNEKIGEALDTFSLAEFEGVEPEPRRWLVADLIPDRTVTMLSGDGGVGKSLLALQLAIAVASNTQWLGLAAENGPVIYASAEDERNEIHRRALDIAKAEGLALPADVHVVDLAGRDAIMGALDQAGMIKPTALWKRLVRRVAQVRPRLIVLDTLADVYAGNENVREQVRQFVGQLRGLAIDYDCAVLLLSHPSLTGMGSGSGASGSTAWNNSVRSRLYLTRPEEEADRKRDPDLRVLRTMKLNYAAGLGDERRVRWSDGRFVVGLARVTVEADDEAAFLLQLAAFEKQGRAVTSMTGHGYAPKLFNEADTTISKKSFEQAMRSLFEAGAIALEDYGPKSRGKQKLVAVGTLSPNN